MASKAELIEQAKKKWERDQLVSQAKSKWAQENQSSPSDPGLLSKIETGARSALEGATLGISEPAISGINALLSQAQDAYFDPNESFDLEGIKEEYGKDVERRRALEAALPGVSIASEVAGALTPLGPLGIGSKVAKGLGSIGAGAIKSAPFVKGALEAGPVARTLAKGAIGAGEGVGAAVGSEGVRQLIERPTGFIRHEDDVASPTDPTLVGISAALGASPTVFGAGAKLAGMAGRKLLSTAGGVSEGVIKKYIVDPAVFKKAKTITEIKDEVDRVIQNLRDDVASGERTVEEVKELHRTAKEGLRDAMQEAQHELRQNKFDVKMALKEANANLDDAYKVATEPIIKAKAPTRLADDVLDSVSELKRKVTEGSQNAYKVLERQPGKLSIAGLDKEAEGIQNSLKIGSGKESQVIGETAQQAFNKIEEFRTRIKSLPENISYPDAKKLIQQLDKDIKWITTSGGFSDDASNAFLQIRRAVDERLKDIPEYASVMQGVAEDTNLLKEAGRLFGKRENALAKLARIDSEPMVKNREILAQLGQKTGKDFETPLAEYMKSRQIAKDPAALLKIKEGLPEYIEAAKAGEKLSRVSDPSFNREAIESVLKSSPEAMALGDVEKKLATSTALLEGSRTKLEPFARISPATSENLVRSVLNEKSVEIRRMMKSLSQVGETDFVKMIEDLKVAQSFDKEFRQGSRNVNLWALMGVFASTLGATGDLPTALIAAGAGAGFGSMVDRYGPKMTQKILDGYTKIIGMPTVQKIDQAFQGIPPEIRARLKSDLVRSVSIMRQNGPVVIPENERTNVRVDIQKSKIPNVMKAKAMNSLNTDGSVDEDILNSVISGGHSGEGEGL